MDYLTSCRHWGSCTRNQCKTLNPYTAAWVRSSGTALARLLSPPAVAVSPTNWDRIQRLALLVVPPGCPPVTLLATLPVTLPCCSASSWWTVASPCKDALLWHIHPGTVITFRNLSGGHDQLFGSFLPRESASCFPDMSRSEAVWHCPSWVCITSMCMFICFKAPYLSVLSGAEPAQVCVMGLL